VPKLDEQLSTLQGRLAQLKLKSQRIEARRLAIAAARERKADTRRKIVLGGLVMDKMRDSDAERREVLKWLDARLTRAADRLLFGLAPLGVPVGSGESQTTPGLEGDDRDAVR
jgi:hypothetical protein